jgi:hypothetical protein
VVCLDYIGTLSLAVLLQAPDEKGTIRVEHADYIYNRPSSCDMCLAPLHAHLISSATIFPLVTTTAFSVPTTVR